MRVLLPDIFEGQPRIITVAVLLYYVLVGPYVAGQSLIVRPKFPLSEALTVFLTLLACIIFSVKTPDFLTLNVYLGASIKIFLFAITTLITASFLRRTFITFIITLYQRRAPSMVRSLCKQNPSCSEYMKLAVIKYGWIKGVRCGWTRLTNCDGQWSSDPP